MNTPKSIFYALGICTIFLVSWNLPTTFSNESIDEIEENTDQRKKKKIYKGEATYYHNKYHGRKTASGERYNKNKYTAAIRSNKIKVPFGTMVEVKNLKNGKTVQVKVNDRMSSRASAMIDLSRKAAKDLGMIEDGRIKVEVRVIN